MKKLMITMVALASGLAAWTANAAGDGSQGSSWVASDKTAGTWNGDSLWKSDTEGLLDNTEKVSFVYDETDTSKNCLKLSTGTDIVKRAINADESHTVSQGQYYFDVNMDLLGQALDTVPTLSDDDKFALFLLDCDEFKDSMSSNQWVNVKGTNLCAIALDPKTNNKILLVYNQNSASSLFGGGDSRVTIQAYADVTGNADAPVPGFVVYLNGNSASETSPLGIEYVVPYDKDNSAPAWANLKSVGEYSYLVGKIASSLNQKRLKIAMSLVGGTNGQKMKGLSFAGNAEISSVAMQVDAPIKIEEDSKTVTVNCEHVTVAVETGGFTYDSAEGTLSGEAGQTCTFSVTPEEGYPVIKVIGDVTLNEDGKYTYTYVEGDEISFMAYAIGATATIDGGDAINYASLADLLASDAFANAEESAGIKLNADATIDCLAAEGKAVTLDLNGKTITGKGSEDYKAVIYSTGAGLTIKDSSEDKTGKVVVAEDAVEGCAAVAIVENEYDVSIEAGIFDGKIALTLLEENQGAISISGGSFLASANTAEQEGEGEGTDEEVTEADANTETDTPTDTTETTAEPTFALADYVVEGKKAELNEAKDYWVIVDDSTPVVKTWADYLGEAVDGAYQIDTEDELFALQANGKTLGTTNITFKLMADITLTKEWTGIGLEKGDVYSFDGTFDGNGKTISNVVFADLANGVTDSSANNYRGFFGKVSSTGVIKNLTVSGTGFGTTTSDEYGCAMIVGVLDGGTIENCTAEGTITSGTHNVGGICIKLNTGTIKGCTNKVNVTGNYTKVGGVCVFSNGGGTIEDCVNEGSVTAVGDDATNVNAGRDGVGGIIGYAQNGTLTIKNCTNKGVISKGEGACACNAVGQIIGYYLSGTLVLEGTNKVLPGYSTIGVTANGNDKVSPAEYATADAYLQNVSGLNYAALPAVDDLVTLVKDDALAADTTYKVMAHGRTYTLAATESKVTFDESLNTVTVALAESLANDYEIAKAVVGEASAKVTTYSVAAKAVEPTDWPENPSTVQGQTAAAAFGITGDLANADAAALATWAKAKSVSFDGRVDALSSDTALKAFLLNVAVDVAAVEEAEAAFKIPSITVGTDGTVTVASPTGTFNGTVTIKGCATLNGTYNLEADDDAARFFKAFLSLTPVATSAK